MKLHATPLPGLYEVALDTIDDERGTLVRAFDADEFHAAGTGRWRWAQAVQSHTATRNTLRGIHVQLPPHAEGKLVVPARGRMFWVCVDVRDTSPTFGHWHSVEASADRGTGLLAEAGFAHGCLSLTDDADLTILSTERHRPAFGAGVHWQDPELAIAWPDLGAAPRLSAAHAAYGSFAALRPRLAQPRLPERAHA